MAWLVLLFCVVMVKRGKPGLSLCDGLAQARLAEIGEDALNQGGTFMERVDNVLVS